jgi:nucleoside-diphosphate-sugar epimerase
VVAARERFRRVIGAVSALPPRQRQVIVRHAVDGDSHARIATDLGMSAGSIRQLAHRARRTIRAAATSGAAPGRAYNIGGGSPVSVNAALAELAAIAGRPLDVRRSSPEAGDVSHTAADSTRARDELGFAPATSLSEGLRAEYEWVRRRVEAEPEKALRKAG